MCFIRVKNLKQEKEKREKELEVLRRKKIERDNEYDS